MAGGHQQLDALSAVICMLMCCALLVPSAVAAHSPPTGGGTPEQPNLLLLFPDQWRYDWDGHHSDPTGAIPLRLPTLDALGRRSTRFTQAFVPAPVCAPSRSCLASGREYDHAGVACNFCNDYPINQTTFYTVLQDQGYWTMVAGKDDLTKKTQPGPNGLFHQKALGFSDGLRCSGKDDVIHGYPKPHEPYGYYLRNHSVAVDNHANVTAWESHYACFRQDYTLCDTTSFPMSMYEDNWVGANGLKLLRRKPAGKPWFLQLNYPGPHSPFVVPTVLAESVEGRKWPPPTDPGNVDETCHNVPHAPSRRLGRCNYGAEIENLDRLFGLVLRELETTGELNNTIVCVSSDHGEMLGDHGDTGKTMPWQGSVSVPLLCSGPGIVPDRVVSTPVTTMDLAGTFIDYAGGKPVPGMTTRSLRGVLEGREESNRDYISSGLQSSPFGSTRGPGPLVSPKQPPARSWPLAKPPAPGGQHGYNWRLVVTHNATTTLKFICCKGHCNGAPSTAPGPNANGFTQLLYNVLDDEFDMHDIAPQFPEDVARMRALLPPEFGCNVPRAPSPWNAL